MGREVRMVPPDWAHPKNEHGRLIPLYEPGWEQEAVEWDKEKAAWDRGERPSYFTKASAGLTFAEYHGERPLQERYMPSWPDEARTHYMMYETTSGGTPISPAFATPEELARWLADTGASAFGSATATYEQWLHTCKGSRAPSAAICGGVMMSGVEFAAEAAKSRGESR